MEEYINNIKNQKKKFFLVYLLTDQKHMLSNSNNKQYEEELEANLWRLMRSHKKNSKQILDEKYAILRTIGDGRYAK